ncbi:PK2 [Symbiodinium natans]|uniref:PK2 protein n=1 Tax=Symbiodinium natans TaxID=878477 RepID=A0A812RXJ2_9DINO|nr:PK2 [Symbiodinium natans]
MRIQIVKACVDLPPPTWKADEATALYLYVVPWMPNMVLGNGALARIRMRGFSEAYAGVRSYVDYPVMFATGIRAFGDDKLFLEVLFQNFSGTLHVPADLGLSFYYVPELQSPSTSEDEGEVAASTATQPVKQRQEAELSNRGSEPKAREEQEKAEESWRIK